jgi:uncharacterized membrane protein
MIVPLPIAALLGAFLSDWAFVETQDAFWSRLSFTLLGTGIVTGAVAGVLGILEAASLQRARTAGKTWFHGAGNILVLIISAGSFKLRWEADGLWVPAGIYMSGAVAALLLLTGWLGGSLSYVHGIGVSKRVGNGGTADPDHVGSGAPDIAREH